MVVVDDAAVIVEDIIATHIVPRPVSVTRCVVTRSVVARIVVVRSVIARSEVSVSRIVIRAIMTVVPWSVVAVVAWSGLVMSAGIIVTTRVPVSISLIGHMTTWAEITARCVAVTSAGRVSMIPPWSRSSVTARSISSAIMRAGATRAAWAVTSISARLSPSIAVDAEVAIRARFRSFTALGKSGWH